VSASADDTVGLTSDAGVLLEACSADPASADTLGERLGWAPQRVSAALLELELAGRVATTGHGGWQRLAAPGSGFARAG
jgi:predicted Rossmann fold nucleotide-binding protein DprA/Smf involved in DNA uptake